MFKQKLMQWHRQIGWGASIAIFIWGISSIMHPVMTWFGPQAARSFPPTMVVEGQPLQNLAPVMSSVPNLAESRVIKLVPGEAGSLLQVTRNQLSPRQYYDLQTMEMLPDHDRAQARWLASYYTGLDSSDIEQVEFMTAFTDEYPAVNRLIPVYRVEFGGEQSMVAFVHTETGALASLSNPFKNTVQWVFQHLHTFKWLDSLEFGRLLLVGFFILSMLATGVVGSLLLFSFKPRPIPDGKRRYHRRLAYIAWLPLLAWSASGFYHLMQASLVHTQFGIRLGEPYTALQSDTLNTDSLNALRGQSVNSLSLIRNEGQRLYWRASVARDSSEEAMSREARFAGNPGEQSALYLPASYSGDALQLDDAALARSMALRFTDADASQVMAVSRVRSFSAEYDFRNKRLPVWKVELNDAPGTTVFVDTATGLLVDSNRRIDRVEGWSFGVLHKWSHLTGIMGPQLRDLLIVATVILLLVINILGIPMLLKKRRRKAASDSSAPERPVPA